MRGRIEEMLRAGGKHLSFHTPGHKRTGADITELSYSDNLYSPHGPIAEAERDVAKILHAERSFFLTDGSTSGIFSMLYALRTAGVKKIAAPLYSHVSVRHAAEALSLEILPLSQEVKRGIPLPPTVEEIFLALSAADALLLISPDYYGFFPPLKEAAALCREQKKPLVVDGAHGSHLHFTPLHAGGYADMWVDGVHKSLPALTQGAVVSSRDMVWGKLLEDGVRHFRTSSPSYPILASVEHAVKYPRNLPLEIAAERFKRGHGCLENGDWTKIVVPFGEKSGAAQAALEKKGIYPEFNDGNYILFYLSPCTKLSDLKRLGKALDALPRGEVSEDAPAGVIPIYSEET